MRIDSSGNVGIGTNSIESLLDVRGANKTVSSQYGLLNIYSTDAFAINKGGSITFGGKYATDGSFNQFAGIAGRKEDAGDGGWAGYLQFVTGTTPTERMRIDSAGKITFNTTAQNNNEQVGMVYSSNAGVGFSIQDSNAQNGNTFIQFRNGATVAGTITSNGSTTTAYNTSSDYRLKENVNYNFDATTRLKQLKPARFNFISDANKTVDGFLAHEVSNIIPEAIHGTKDQVEAIGNITDVEGNIIRENVTEPYELPENQTWTQTGTRPVYQGIDQAKLTPLLTKALQEAIARIEQLEARLTALES